MEATTFGEKGGRSSLLAYEGKKKGKVGRKRGGKKKGTQLIIDGECSQGKPLRQRVFHLPVRRSAETRTYTALTRQTEENNSEMTPTNELRPLFRSPKSTRSRVS